MTLDILTNMFINFTILCKLCKLYKLSAPNIPYRNPGVFFYIPPKMSDLFFFSPEAHGPLASQKVGESVDGIHGG